VAKAADLLRRADVEPSHVLIEALVVEFDADELIELGTQLQNYASGELKSLAAAFGVTGIPALTFTYLKGGRETTTATAVIDLMVSTGRARVISRPYLSTVSSREAKIDISQERYVVTQTVQDGTTVSSTDPVQAGISLAITPMVLKDQRVQLKLAVEDSSFIDTTIPNVSVVKDKNSATTSMLVESGQTVIIGGLVLDRRSESNAGLPFLRHVPVLNFLTAQQGSSVQKMEVVVFVTPHVWKPGMALPLVEPNAFKVPEAREIGKPFDSRPQIRIEP
jgi:type II secretory pathway component GspD/PulD (secretin)